MFRNIAPEAIGISAEWRGVLPLAREAGFQGVDLNLDQVAKMVAEESVDTVKELLANSHLRAGGWGLPVACFGTDENFRSGLATLPQKAKLASELGSSWCYTWVLSWIDDLTFDELFEKLTRRFRAVAEVLKDYGQRIGLEFLEPKTLRDGHQGEFIHTMDGMLELCDAIAVGNVGLLLDSWHWHTSRGTVDDLKRLSAGDVVYVHVNDAPAGVEVDELVDNRRKLPGETGVIDLVGFLRVLSDIGYDGPVTPEPFSKRIAELPDDEAARETGHALLRVWQRALGVDCNHRC